jgi:SAM-dependent MidA family methyltransferase
LLFTSVILPVSPVPSAADSIRAAIAASQGSIPFAQFMENALYGSDGFYSTTGRAGRRGDFITSPEVGPLFGHVMSQAIDAVWKRLGEPTDFQIVEVGAGPGTLARSILAASPQCLVSGSYVAVEVSAEQRILHPEGVTSTDVMPSNIEHGVVIANELLDNLPFDLWVYDDGWRNAHVIQQGDGFAELLMTQDVPACLPSRVPHGSRAPVHSKATEWLSSVLGILSSGSVFVIDYCTPLTAEIASMPWREWLRTYAGHERGVHYLRNPGEQDITTQVCIDQLAAVREPDAVRTQSQFLQLWGIDELVEEGKQVWTENAARPTLAAIKMRSRVTEAEALLDTTGLGNFMVLEWSCGSSKEK